jgi:RNA polymerase sigma-70 factor (ECF subfamily)
MALSGRLELPSHWERHWDVALVSAETTTETQQTDVTTLFRVAHSILRNRAESEDVVQDVFLRVLEHQLKAHRHKLPAIHDLRVWLVRITWNLALDRRRRIRPDQLDEPFAESLISHSIPADQALSDARQIAATLREIERLPKPERHALLLSAIDELSITEISTLLHRSESAVRALLFRARTRLRERLEKQDRLEKGIPK